MSGELEANTAGQRIVEFQRAGLAIDRLGHQRLIGKAHDDIAGERRDRWVGPIDLPIRADGLDPVEVIGIGDIGRDHIADGLAVALDRAVEMAKARQRQIGQSACGRVVATVSPCATTLAVAVSSPERPICQLRLSSLQPAYIA
jgi:hypothetical protein